MNSRETAPRFHCLMGDFRRKATAMKIEWIPDLKLPDNFISEMQFAANKSCEFEGISVPCSVCVRLCSDDAIQEINRQYRGIDKSTDVLSFPAVSYPPGRTAGTCQNLLREEYDDDTRCCFLGDIIISVPHLYTQAEAYGHSPLREAAYLLVHGICHLMGYDHINADDKQKMRIREEQILSNLDQI